MIVTEIGIIHFFLSFTTFNNWIILLIDNLVSLVNWKFAVFILYCLFILDSVGEQF